MINESATGRLARQRDAVEDLPHHEDNIKEAAERAINCFWPEGPEDVLQNVATDTAHTQQRAFTGIKDGYTTTWSGAKTPVNPGTTWPKVPANTCGIAEAATLKLRSYERDEKDPDTKMPPSFINRYNRHIAGCYDSAE